MKKLSRFFRGSVLIAEVLGLALWFGATYLLFLMVKGPELNLLFETTDDFRLPAGDSSWGDLYSKTHWWLKTVNMIYYEMDKLLGKVGETLTSKGGTAADHSAKMTFRIDIE